MIVPGSNLLGLALTVIAPQAIKWYPEIGRTENAVGQWVTTYAATPTVLWGSWQPVPKDKYTELGLDLAKNYFIFYTMSPIKALEREISGDRVVFGSKLYDAQSFNADWLEIDGWRGLLCVEIGAAP